MRKKFKLSVLVVILLVLANGVTGCKDDAQEYESVEKCDCGQQFINPHCSRPSAHPCYYV